MCKMASFLWKHDELDGFQIAVYDLESHSETQKHLPTYTEKAGWFEGHYTPQGEIELRSNGKKNEYIHLMRERFPRFVCFWNWAMKREVKFSHLDLRGCDLKWITLPTTIGGSLALSGCELKGITLPTTISGDLDLRDCDLKGITLPTTIGGSLYLSCLLYTSDAADE